MGENTKIEWCDHTFNPWIGCSKVSAGCAHCYAEKFAGRFPALRGCWGVDGRRVRTSDANWRKPLAWDRAAAKFPYACDKCGSRYSDPDALGRPWKCAEYGCDGNLGVQRPRVFCGSLCDVFEDREDMAQTRADLFTLIHTTPHLNWLLLTKRPENVEGMIDEAYYPLNGLFESVMLERVWIGASVENQAAADERIPELLGIPAAKRFLSVEPMLEGPLDIGQKLGNVPAAKWSNGEYTPEGPYPWESRWVELIKTVRCDWPCDESDLKMIAKPGIYRARSNKHGALSVMTEGGLLGIKPSEFRCLPALDWVICGGESGPNARPMDPAWVCDLRDQCVASGVPFLFKQWGGVNKKAAGRVLDGRTWDERPE